MLKPGNLLIFTKKQSTYFMLSTELIWKLIPIKYAIMIMVENRVVYLHTASQLEQPTFIGQIAEITLGG